MSQTPDFVQQQRDCRFLTEVVRAALKQTAPPPLPKDCDWARLYDAARFHSLEGMIWPTVQAAVTDHDPALAAVWQRRTDQLLLQTLTQWEALQTLTQQLGQAGIPLVQLKGLVLRDLYPQPTMRQLSDLDLLIHPEQAQAAAALLTEQGYRLEEDAEQTPYHRGYVRPPYLQVELHTDLLDPQAAYYPAVCDPWGHLAPSGDRLDALYTYLYCVIHAAKHYYYKGTGIRTVLDLYLLRRYCPPEEAPVQAALRAIHLEAFHRDLSTLGECWFGDGQPLPAELESMARVVWAAGTHGSPYAHAAGAVAPQRGTVSFVLHRAFPDFATMQATYPVLSRYPVLLPWFWGHRLVRRLVGNPRVVAKELGVHAKMKR